MRRYVSIIIVIALLSPVLALPTAAAPREAPFLRRWSQDDGAVARGEDDRTWTWGPTVTRAATEPYVQSPGSWREVWYLDKGRMEISHPGADPDDEWYVTSGLLVRELISGEMQMGDAEYEYWEPAAVPVAGDLEAQLAQTITYADLRPLAAVAGGPSSPIRSTSEPLVEMVSPDGIVAEDQRLASYNMRLGGYDEVVGHNIAAVFRDALPAASLLYLAGRPLTEPYWARVPVNHEPRDVLIQAFERRVLTYTPSNAEHWRVEWGNVGQQYVLWRYGDAVEGEAFDPSATTETAGPRSLRELTPVAANIARDRRGWVAAAVLEADSGSLYSFQGTEPFPMYSVVKVPIMLTVLDRAVREERRVAPWEQNLIERMIQVSDNESASVLLANVGGAQAVQRYLHRIGIVNTTINGYAWGASTTTAQDMARLMVKLGNCTILVPRLCRYALQTMQGIARSQRWGVSAGVPPVSLVALKNGWYPQRSGWGVNSIGFIASGNRRYAVVVFTNPNPSMAYGIETIEGISRAVTNVYFGK